MSLVDNKKARFNYEILETMEAGLDLEGGEVKSLRRGQGTLEGSHVVIRGGEAFLVGATIPPYQPKNQPNYEPDRARRLLLTKEQIKELVGTEQTSKLTIIPLSVYNKGRFLKLAVAIARGKKKGDKREVIKKRDVERDLRRSLT
ncbi:MAG: SsrA-binding protein SmpB [bacterium]|nr:SsrA-binding protein SmpB [bacterium]